MTNTTNTTNTTTAAQYWFDHFEITTYLTIQDVTDAAQRAHYLSDEGAADFLTAARNYAAGLPRPT
jgi:hypothetical protein